MTFEWDPEKAAANLDKHGVSFEEATTVFGDPLSSCIADPLHADAEQRFVLVGLSSHGRLLVVVHREQDEQLRIISARRATRRERTAYETDL